MISLIKYGMSSMERLCFSPKFSDKVNIGMMKRQDLIAYRDEFPQNNKQVDPSITLMLVYC